MIAPARVAVAALPARRARGAETRVARAVEEPPRPQLEGDRDPERLVFGRRPPRAHDARIEEAAAPGRREELFDHRRERRRAQVASDRHAEALFLAIDERPRKMPLRDGLEEPLRVALERAH